MTLADTYVRDHLPPADEWPDLLIEPLGYPAQLNCAAELVGGPRAAGRGGAVALAGDDEALTYDELADLVERLARVLVEELGLASGGRVLLRAPNSPLLAALWLAAIHAGGVAVATMPLLRRRELVEIVQRGRIDLAIVDPALTDELAGLCATTVLLDDVRARAARVAPGLPPHPTAADDPALLAFTSGTTGRPKATVHFHRDVLAICDTFSREIVRPTPDDVFIGTPPIAFTFGLGGLVTFPLRAGATGVLIGQGSPERLLAAIERHGATICFTAPTAYRRMLAAGRPEALRSLRRCVSAGEHLPRAVFDAFAEATGLQLIDGIGATEMLHVFISAADERIRPGATGLPVPGYEARIVDGEGRELPPGTVGRLAVRGPTGCRYLDDARQRDYVQGGWNLTGDAYLMDADGYFHYQSRTDDMIVTGGYNIAGAEVEEALALHPAVLECAVVGSRDEARGTIVKAYVVAAPGNAPGPELARVLQEHVKATIAPYKYPRAVEFLDALPRTQTGKVQRFVLRER